MKEYIFQKIISEICNCRNGGFGYIESFMNVLGEYQQDLNISAGVVSWSLQSLGKNFNYCYFVNNNRINLDSFKIDMMALHNGILDSKEVDFKKYINSSEFAGSHIIAIPIHYQKGTEVLIEIHGVVLLISTKTINISPNQIQAIYTLLSNQSPSTLRNSFVCDAINELASDIISIKDLTLKDRHRTLNRALDLLSCKEEDKLSDHGLRHFSFCSVDNDNEMTISKEFNKNTYGNALYTDTYCDVKDYCHYFYSYAKSLKDKSLKDIDIIRFLDYNEFKPSSIVNDYFNNIGITAERGVVIIASIDFGTYSNICCFYVRDIIYTPFISITFIQQFVNAIKQRIVLVNEINIKIILSRMISQELSLSNTIDFYRNVVDILKKGNEAKECFIYFLNSRNSRFLMVSEECEKKSSSKKEANFEDGSITFFLPSDYLYDDPFIKSLHKEITNQEHQYFLYKNPQGDIVKSYCLIKIFNDRKELYGFVLLLNKKYEIATKSQGIYFHDTFDFDNVYITNACIQYLMLHRNLELLNIHRDELLKKLRHEIPNCAQVINKNIKEIEQTIPPLTPPTIIKKIRRKSLGVKINCNRIELLASFFSAIDFDEEQLLNNPHPFDIRDYLSDNIDLFREEASYRGIDLGYSIDENAPILFVSNFYQLSLTNIIKNAIGYASPGTRIIIIRTPQTIEITDIGIPIEYSERDKIFEEGFRGMNARCVDPNGKGYGLYLSKRIIEAHGHSIEVKSELLSGSNYLAKSALYSAFSKMEKSKADEYIYPSQLEQSEVSQVSQLLFDLKFAHQRLSNYDKRFVNTDQECLEQWIDYNKVYNYHILDMQDDIFNKPIYKVSFIINTK